MSVKLCKDCKHFEPDMSSYPVSGLPLQHDAWCRNPKGWWPRCVDARARHPAVTGATRLNDDYVVVQRYSEAEMREAECGPEGKLFEAKARGGPGRSARCSRRCGASTSKPPRA